MKRNNVVLENELIEQRKFDRITKSNAIIYNSLYFASQDRNLQKAEKEGKSIRKRMREDRKTDNTFN